MIENPRRSEIRVPAEDVLSDVLRRIRLSGSLQFCFMPSGAWETEAGPSLSDLGGGRAAVIPFHIMVEGSCWLRMEGGELVLRDGDVVAFPFGTGHQLGAGSGGRRITPVADLPPKPWREMPILRYGDGPADLRLLCGFLQCDAISFRPMRDALPKLLHVRTAEAADTAWLRATIGQIVAEVDHPRPGSVSMLERLTEVTFIELLRHQMIATRPDATGWLAALADPALGQCLSLIHENPCHEWSLKALSAASGLSRSALTERFETMLATSPMRYLRDWRLCLASQALSTTARPLAAIAYESGYGTEAAFNRAFSRAFGMPPAAWRRHARRGEIAA